MDRRARAVKRSTGRDDSDLTRVQVEAETGRQRAMLRKGSGDDPNRVQLVTSTAKQLGVDARNRVGFGNVFATACAECRLAALEPSQPSNSLEAIG